MKDEELAIMTRVFACIEVGARELYGMARDLENIKIALWAIFVAIMMNTCATQQAHAQVSGQVVPPGCYTSFEDDNLCWEPDPGEEALFPYFEYDPGYALDYLGPVVGTLSNRYVEQYNQLLRWKRLARDRARRILRMRSNYKWNG